MITLFSSTSYTREDYKWLMRVLQTGLSLNYCDEDKQCQNCERKQACGDLARFYHFVSNKVDSGADRSGKRQAD